jgi:hypothetical protein
MLDEPFYQTQQGEIFQSSNCMQHEHAVANLFTSWLTMLGYTRTDSSNRSWQRGHKKVIVCLSDDFGVCRKDFGLAPAEWFDADTVVFTDNHMPWNTQYQVCQLPVSYFGVFSYIPNIQKPVSNRARFHFSANRLDPQRLQLMLELIKHTGPIEQNLAQDYINFNGWDPYNANQTAQDIVQNVERCWQQLPNYHTDYCEYFNQLVATVPLRNHQLSIEQAHVSSQLNLVIETYAGDASIALSEKIFRALVTPAPWTVFSAQNAVKYLQTLGFDVLSDLVDHSYDTHLHDEHKGRNYIQHSARVQQALQPMDESVILQRCQQAAQHNQQLLQQMKQRWPADFANWLPTAIVKIQ